MPLGSLARSALVSGRLSLVLLFVLLFVPAGARAADPLDGKAVPEPLKPWTAWALDGRDDATCPVVSGHGDTPRCTWPSRLELNLDEHGGRFSQAWHADAGRWVPLPGDAKRWPAGVSVDGKPAVVVARTGAPSVELRPGDHVVTGLFAWDSPPEALRVPPETGLLTLTLRGASVPWPNRDAQGMVWLQRSASKEEGDALEIVVHRKITDDVPTILTTRVELHVSGKNREELLGKALPAGFVPMSMEAPLPARVEPDGRLRVQVRPGIYTLQLEARSEGPVRALTRPAPEGPWRDGEEVWVFEAKNDLRVVTVEGVPSIDPQQTTLPDGWKALPAYPMKVGDTLALTERRRGDADPPPNQLSLVRTLWLDFDGAGYSVSDQLTGTLNRDSRLTMAPPTVLGRVAVGGRDQFITHLDGASAGSGALAGQTGVEVRQGELSVTADSRIVSDPTDIPAVGWAHDFHQVTGTLHLPPGWRLLHATGVDEVPGTWVKHWSLLELFLALIVAIGIARLYGLRWGAVALAMLFLTLPEDDAPKWSWLFVLAIEGLLRVLPQGWITKLFEGARLAALIVIAIITVPFLVQHVREGMYPALANESSVEAEAPADQSAAEGAGGGPLHDALVIGGAAAPEPLKKPAPAENAAPSKDGETNDKAESAGKGRLPQAAPATPGSFGSGLDYRQSNSQVYDPAAVVQTGPGLPRWRWTTLDLRWSGPVAATQRVHLYLLSPFANLILALLRAALLVVVFLRMMPWTQRFFPRGWSPAAAALAIGLVVLSPRPARADVPDKATLDELATRLTRRPDCSPDCASQPRMAIELKDSVLRVRLEVDASAATAVPLPGSAGDWSPAHVLLDGHAAGGLLRTDDGVLWIEVSPGRHQVSLDGPMPDRETVPLALHMKPHRVDVSSTGWSVAGVHEDGLADDDLEITRQRVPGGSTGAALQPGVLPPFVRVERTLRAGLDWQVDTRVVRVTPTGPAVVLEVPLLPGESVTTADVRVQGGKAQVHLAPQASEVSWHSVLDERSPLTLVAPKSLAWIEVWRVDVGPIWHATFSGIPFVHTQPVAGVRVPEWHPWPGEEVGVALVRPDGVAGQTLTIDQSTTAIEPGLRATDVTLTLQLRSSRGGEHTITLPPTAQLESMSINGATQPIRQQGAAVTIPVVPGSQTVVLTWRQTPGLSTVYTGPVVDLGAPSVNATTTVAVPGAEWLLLAGGPRVGPAVLFWSLLLVLLVVSLILGGNRWTPLRWWHWLLLSIGLSQVSVEVGAVFVGWLLALGWRAREPGRHLGRRTFNLIQVGLVLWSLVALVVLGVSLYQGLLGAPEMQVRGNDSTSDLLRWFTDRAPGVLPSPWMVSVPILVYRASMLAWALWIALALLRWLRWGWDAFTSGEGWRKKPPRPVVPFAPPFVPPGPWPAGQGPSGQAPPGTPPPGDPPLP